MPSGELGAYGLKGARLLDEETREDSDCIRSFPGLEKVDGEWGIGDTSRMGRVAVFHVLESSLRMEGHEKAQDTMRHLQIGWEQRGSAVGTGWLRGEKRNGKDQGHYWAIHE